MKQTHGITKAHPEVETSEKKNIHVSYEDTDEFNIYCRVKK